MKVCGLGDPFLEVLNTSKDYLFSENVEFHLAPPKPQTKLPLFSLLTEDEYHVAEEIINRVNNPFLGFVNSPEEILLCNELFLRNSAIPPGTLTDCHFETLLLCEFAKERVKGLTHLIAKIDGKNKAVSPGGQGQINSLLVRVQRLETFVGDIEGQAS
ncbi:MAG: hypothetical protein JRI75_01940 [Deltaproteobacteria bacterium]|nr:hypothetical protein [Deltaproteobacteria bacterium]